MTALNTFRDAGAVIEWYLRAHDPAQPWPVEIVRLACVLNTAGSSARMALIAAKALRTLPDDDRLALLDAANMPGQVRNADTDQDWPAPIWPEQAAIDLGAFKARALAQVNGMIDAAAVRITGSAPEAEKLSWTTKEGAARAYLVDPASLSPADVAMLTPEAAARNDTVAALAALIITRADAYRAAIGALVAVRVTAETAVTVAEDAAGIEVALTAAAQQIDALLGAGGA